MSATGPVLSSTVPRDEDVKGGLAETEYAKEDNHASREFVPNPELEKR
jgi:hypothetical protein